MEGNRRRLQSAYRFEVVDRVPVLLGIETPYILHERNVTFQEYFSDASTQFIYQLENIKWRIEHIPDDWFVEPIIVVSPDFQNVTNASGCGCEIYWQDDNTPQSVQRFSSVDDMGRHQFPEWRKTLWGRKFDWFFEMEQLAKDVVVTLNGERIPLRVTVSINGDSPFMSAVDLAGANFYEWLLEEPDACQRFLERIAEQYIEVETEYRRVSGRPFRDGLNYSDDSAQVISLDLYRKFCVPVAKRLYGIFGSERFDGRLMHLCGRHVHLQEALRDDLRITMLHGYGFANKPEEMLTVAGKVILQGNVDPMVLYQGTPTEIEMEAGKVLETLAPFGGIILGDGYNVVPGTSLSHLEILRKTSQKYGKPKHRSQAQP